MKALNGCRENIKSTSADIYNLFNTLFMKKTIWTIFAIVIVLLLVMTGSNNKAGTTAGSNKDGALPAKVKIGVMAPLSGDVATYGEAVKKGIQMAQRDLGTENIEVIYQDSKCKAPDAVSAFNSLKADGVVAIIGEFCSSALFSVAPLANQSMIPMVSPSATSPKITGMGDYVFRVVPSDLFQGEFGAKLVSDKGFKSVAIINTNEDYGIGLAEAFTSNFTKLGGKVVAAEVVISGSTDLRTQITKIKASKPDAVFLAMNSADSGVSAMKQMRELGLNVQIFASESMNSGDVLKSAGKSAEGMVVMSVTPGTTAFMERYKKENADENPTVFTAQAYDAFAVLRNAIGTGAKTGDAIKTALHSVEFDGVTGHVKFDQNGDVGGQYAVFKVVGGKFVAQ